MTSQRIHQRKKTFISHSKQESAIEVVADITRRLAKADPEINRFVARLRKRNKDLQIKITHLEADQVSDRNKIAALERQLADELKKEKLTVTINKIK